MKKSHSNVHMRFTGISPSLAVITVSALVCLSVFHPYPYDNVVTRWGLAERLVRSSSLRIDPWSHLTSDKAVFQGHYYSDKSFLPSVAAALSVLPLRPFGYLSGPDAYPIGGTGRYVAERLTVSLALILLLLLLRKYCRRDGISSSMPLLAMGLGSILLPYSTLLYTHAPAAFLLFACYYAQRRESYLASDFLGALAVSYEYTLILPFMILLIYRGRDYWSLSRSFRTLAVIFVVFLPQLLHNWIAFGNPFSLGYGLEAHSSFPVASRGFFGFTYPSFGRLFMILLSPERGIFFYMPWAFLGFWGFFQGRRLGELLRDDPLPVLVVSYILLYSAQNAVTAGWAYGQRYLIPILPFLALGLGKFASGTARKAAMASAAILPGILMALLGVFGELHLPVHPVSNPVPLPQLNISLRMLLDGHHSNWLLGPAGASLTVACTLALWVLLARRKGIRLTSFAWLPIWLALALPSAMEDWGGKIDYYRGVLAQHRWEWSLAAEYYEAALQDETAPQALRDRYEYAKSMAEDP